MKTTRVNRGRLSGIVYCADAIEMLKDIGSDSADILFLDPPFNLGKRYSNKRPIDNKPVKEYEACLPQLLTSQSVR